MAAATQKEANETWGTGAHEPEGESQKAKARMAWKGSSGKGILHLTLCSLKFYPISLQVTRFSESCRSFFFTRKPNRGWLFVGVSFPADGISKKPPSAKPEKKVQDPKPGRRFHQVGGDSISAEGLFRKGIPLEEAKSGVVLPGSLPIEPGKVFGAWLSFRGSRRPTSGH